MKKIMAALLMIAVALAVSPVLAASKKVSVVAETTVKKLPPAKQRPMEVGSRHEAYLSGHSLIGTLLLKGENRDAVLDLAAKRGAMLAWIYYDTLLVGVDKKHLSRYEPAGSGKMRMEWSSTTKEVPGFYVELFAPGANYEEGARRFCDCLFPVKFQSDCVRSCGTIEDMERYMDLGIDPNIFVGQLRTAIVDYAYSISWINQALPHYEGVIEMVKLLLRRGADLSSYIAYLTERIDGLDRRIRGRHPDDVAGIDASEYRWPPPVKDPKSRGLEYGRMFLAEIQRLILEHAKR